MRACRTNHREIAIRQMRATCFWRHDVPLHITNNPTNRKSLLTRVKPIRWYNPELEDFEWREVPKSDEEALLNDHPSCRRYVEVYEEWRALGAPIMAALIRAGEAAQSTT